MKIKGTSATAALLAFGALIIALFVTTPGHESVATTVAIVSVTLAILSLHDRS